MDNNRKPKKSERLICRKEEDSLLVFDSHSGDIKILNETAECIWNAIDGNTPISTIVDEIAKKNPDAKKQVIRDDIYGFLEELQELGFIED